MKHESFKEDFNVNEYFIRKFRGQKLCILWTLSGKTSVAIKCCNKLIQRYSKDEDVTNICVFAIVFDVTTEMRLVKTFKENINSNDVRCETFNTLLKEANYHKTSIDSFL